MNEYQAVQLSTPQTVAYLLKRPYLFKQELALMAYAWDQAVSSMKYEDGTPVEIIDVLNPYQLDNDHDE